jgi:TRAP-type C4-dicarboxylate transport system permease small subunit
MTNILGRTADLFALMGGVILLVIVAVTTTNVGAFMLDRIAGAFGADVRGLPGYEDFVRLAISAAGLMFFPFCQASRGHVSVDLFIAKASYGFRRATDRLWLIATAGIAVFLAWWMVFGLLEKQSDHAVTGVLGWAEWPFYIPGILSMILWALVALSQMPGETADV